MPLKRPELPCIERLYVIKVNLLLNRLEQSGRSERIILETVENAVEPVKVDHFPQSLTSDKVKEVIHSHATDKSYCCIHAEYHSAG